MGTILKYLKVALLLVAIFFVNDIFLFSKSYFLKVTWQKCEGKKDSKVKTNSAIEAAKIDCVIKNVPRVFHSLLDIQKLEQMKAPITPCYWLGDWVYRNGSKYFALSLEATGRFHITMPTYSGTAEVESGFWSSSSKSRIILFNKENSNQFIELNTAVWSDLNHFVLKKGFDFGTAYSRSTPQLPRCADLPK